MLPAEQRKSQQPGAIEIIWLSRILAGGLLISLALALVSYFQGHTWQQLAVSGFLLLALACIVRATRIRYHDTESSGSWLILAVIVAYGGTELFFRGITLASILSGALFIALIGGLTMPRKWPRWLGLISLFSLALGLVNKLHPFPRYNIIYTSSSHLILLITAGMALGMLLRAARLSREVNVLERTVADLRQVSGLLQHRLRELTLLQTVAVVGSEAGSEEELLERTTRLIGEALHADNFGVLLLDSAGGVLRLHASYRLGAKTERHATIPLGQGLTGATALDGQARCISDITQEPGYVEINPRTRSELCVPIKIGEKIIGVLNTESDLVNAFTAADERLLVTLAGQLAPAIEQLRNVREVRREAQYLTVINEIGQRLTAILTLDTLLPEIGRSLAEILQLYNVEIALIENELLVFHAGYGGYVDGALTPGYTLELGQGITGKAATTGETVFVPDVQACPDYISTEQLPDVRAELAVPLIAHGEIIGVLDVKSDRVNGIHEQESAILEILAAQVAVAIQNARLFRTTREAAQRLSILHWGSQEITRAGLDMERLYITIHQATARLMPSEAFVISLLDEQRQDINLVYLVDHSGRMKPRRFSRDVGLSGHVITTGKSLCVTDMEQVQDIDVIHFGDPEHVRSFLAVPLRLGNRVFGMLSTQSYQPHAYTQNDQNMLELLAAHAAIVLENARLFADERERNAELQAVRQASLHVTSTLKLKPVLQVIMEHTLELVKATDAHIFLYDGERLHFGAARWAGEARHKPFAAPREDGLTYLAARAGQRIVVPDIEINPLFVDTPWKGAITALPLCIGEQVIGVMNIAFDAPHHFDENELRALELLADQAAVAIRNAELFEAAQRQLQELSLLHAVSTVGATVTDEDTLIAQTTDLIGEALYPDSFGILLLDNVTGVLDFHPSYRIGTGKFSPVPIPLGQGIIGQVALTGQPRRVADVSQEPDYLSLTGQMRSELCVPLQVGGQCIGVLNAESRQLHAFTDNDERLLVTLAGQLATAIGKARLLAEAQERAQELAAALERLEQLSHSKNKFFQNISHELGTPLSIIRLQAELMEDGAMGPLQPQQEKAVGSIARRSRMLSTMIKDLNIFLMMATKQLRPQPMDLVSLVKELLIDFQVKAAAAGLTLLSEITSASVEIFADPVNVERVVDNLLGNALKFTPAGGVITLKLHKDAKCARLQVADTGIGIPAEELSRIFERGYKVATNTSSKYDGRGLGLALVRELVEAQGGEISVHSVVGEGSTFCVTCPLLKKVESQKSEVKS